jgi:hypothetical protein
MSDYELETPVRMAVIKLDNYETTGSTGGVVEYIAYKRFTGEGRSSPYTNSYENDKTGIIKEGYLAIRSNTAEPGWIYTDKTNILLDSNKK